MASSKNLSGTDFMYSMQSMLYTSLIGCVFIGLLYCFEYFVNHLRYYRVPVGFDGFLPPPFISQWKTFVHPVHSAARSKPPIPLNKLPCVNFLSIDSKLNLNQIDDGFILLFIDCTGMCLFHFPFKLFDVPTKTATGDFDFISLCLISMRMSVA